MAKDRSEFEKLLSVGGIAGVIALMISGAIAFRYVMHGPEEVPQILTYSLTTIIGFYFGSTIKPLNQNSMTPHTDE